MAPVSDAAASPGGTTQRGGHPRSVNPWRVRLSGAFSLFWPLFFILWHIYRLKKKKAQKKPAGPSRDQLVNTVELLAAEEPEVSPQELVETRTGAKEEGELDLDPPGGL